MANTKSAAKRARQTVVRTKQNRRALSALKTQTKGVRAAIKGGKKDAVTGLDREVCLDRGQGGEDRPDPQEQGEPAEEPHRQRDRRALVVSAGAGEFQKAVGACVEALAG